ncbi:Toll-like receptor 7 [Pseudolycoriella hygida]|uniref:Toll-like receptor 7 n=1 Tax=Pseudolycoriella hygida TaxID=35572 RepID=A0A9Q0RUQ8_9DIPT|nr:Toll-like receptor 7 [Pseudolycoriella hygida]
MQLNAIMMNWLSFVYISFLALQLRRVCGECTTNEDRSSVVCSMKSIERSSVVDIESVVGSTRLAVNCDESHLLESFIPNGFFKRLIGLEELYIESCKLLQMRNESFDGLNGLRTLSLNTRNSEWGLGHKLELDDGIFNGFDELQSLVLSNNNMRQLQKNLLCPLKRLTNLNLSNNRIRSTADLGFVQCDNLSELKNIDLSYNDLFTLDANWTVTDMRSVESLLLQENNLTKISSSSLDNLISMRVLNLSSNYLEILPHGLFNKTMNLQEIYLQNNKIYQLPMDTFNHLSELLVLDLSGNQLSSHYIDKTIFSELQRLVILNLANNALTRIDVVFSELHFLQILDLKNNSIGFVDHRAFISLTNLHTLNLSGNRLHIVNNGLFNGLFVLTRLVLSNNLITVVESSAFKNCSSLKELDLSSNQLTHIPESIRDLSMLRSLDLGENRISFISNDSFKGLSQLTGLRMMDNLIGNLTCGVLYDLPKLNVLNLARNKIQSIQRGAFDKNIEIEAIRLDKNLLTDINGIFATLNSLLWLNLSENQLIWFDYAFIPMNLKWLDVHGNYIEALGNYYKLINEITITTLDASHNRITEIGPSSVPNSIEMFFVNNNLIRTVYPNTFVDKINLTRVDLYSNAITKLHVHAVRTASMLLKKTVPEFYLGGNPFECDCSMGWLHHRNDIVVHAQHSHHPKIVDYDAIECLVSHKRDNPVRLLSTLSHQDFLCRYESQCHPTCHCCEQTDCHCNIICPDNCSCFRDQQGTINTINCGKQNALFVPDNIPVDSTALYVDGNNFIEMKNNAFVAMNKLRSLYLNNSNIVHLQRYTFSGLNSLQKLHLDDNKLTELYGYEFDELKMLRELYLHDNLLTQIGNRTFASLPSLQILRLDGNKIATLSSWQMQSSYLTNLKTLTLGQNSWSCGCEFLQEFITFVYDSDVVVRDARDLYCADGDVKRPINSNLTMICKGFDSVVLPEGIPHGYVPLLGFALTIIFVLAVLVAVFTVKEQMCCSYANRSEKHTPTTLYDALVMTSQEDSDYVYRNIVSEIKHQKPSFRIGIQHKNVLTPKIPHIAHRSDRIIIFLSNSFLQHEWKRPEVRSAIANSWMPGKVIIIQTPNVIFATNHDRELISNISKGIILLKTWEMDFSFKLMYALDNPPTVIYQESNDKIWKSHNSKLIHPYACIVDGFDDQPKTDSYYSAATAESVFSHSPPPSMSKSSAIMKQNHVYAGIDSDYGSVTNEDSIVSVHRPIAPESDNKHRTDVDNSTGGFLV